MIRHVAPLALMLALAGAAASLGSTLEEGVRQLKDGELQAAVLTLDDVIRRLEPSDPKSAADLARAYLHKGIALVGLAQEEPAKAAFRSALDYDPALRLSTDDHPPRVVRVFEAARAGKTKSVLLPPSTAPKKAGLGAAGVLGIAAGVAVLGGGAVVVTSRDAPAAPSPTTAPPVPTPTPTPVIVNVTYRQTLFMDFGERYLLGPELEVAAKGRVNAGARQVTCGSGPQLSHLDLLQDQQRIARDACPQRLGTPCDAVGLDIDGVAPGRYRLGVERVAATTPCYVSFEVTFPARQ